PDLAVGRVTAPPPSLQRVSSVPDAAARQQTNGWIMNPVIDMLFCCGGMVWIFFLLHVTFNFPGAPLPILQGLALAVIIGTHALSEPHTAATLARVYRTPDTRKQFALYTHWGALLCLGLALCGLLIQGFTPILAKLYLIWVIQHFTAQSYGLTLL